MPRRSAGVARGGLKPTVFSLLFLIPIVAAAQQQPPRDSNHDAQHVYARSPSRESLINTYAPNAQESRYPPNLSDAHHKSTIRKKKEFANPSDDTRAIATVAPADSNAVRAPRPATRSAAGLSHSHGQPRSLRDWEVEDIVLLATVDGTLHARHRTSGESLWSFVAEKPMVNTTYYKNSDEIGNDDLDDDLYWLVEPSQDGALYVYTPGPDGGLRKLGLTVKHLADFLSPHSSEDPPVVYTAEKKNTLYTVDASTGSILQDFSSTGSNSFLKPGSCRKMNGLPHSDDDECDPAATLTLGRIEYTIGIQNSKTGQPICEINYFEWSPNNRDRDLQSQYITSMDNKYVYSQHDGNVIFLDSPSSPKAPGHAFFKTKFDAPVARVFDVARPFNPDVRESSLVLLPQPIGPAITDTAPDDIFVDCTKTGSLYAMSEMKYPSITKRAPEARCYSREYAQKSLGYGEPTVPEKDALVGRHSLAETEVGSTGSPILPGREPDLLPPGPPKGIDAGDPNESSLRHVPNQPHNDIVITEQDSWLSVSSFKTAIILILLGAFAFLYADPKLKKTTDPFIQRVTENEDISETKVLIESQPIVSRPTTPAPESATAKADKSENLDERHVRFDLAESEARSRDQSVAPGAETADEEAKGDSPDAGENGASFGDEANQETPKKKKAHRGARGGRSQRAKKKKLAQAQTEKEAEDTITAITHVRNAPQHDMPPDSPTIITDGITGVAADSIQINNLLIRTDKVLGNGSGGTFVFEGSFEGRDVAVKRMLPQYFELASQEVDMLRQSDDHPNVIRYFCQQKDPNFLYIAVELCQASLWDLYKDGRRDEILTENNDRLLIDISRDAQKVLYQLAAGLNHLHSLRIIHRDIKPQNILIAYPKKNQKNGTPRLVISDFGLCKTLPDNVSTLVGTTGNAGTVGWKAPELILQPKDVESGKTSSGQADSPNGNNFSTNSNEGGISSGVKRAVDIFSLGCVFFYVLTDGCHPFDDDEGWMQIRELNIKKNKLNLSKLYGPDSQEPAHLIEWMLSPKPEHRPTAVEVMSHPFFWSTEKRLNFLCDCSDHWEREPRDPPSRQLEILESYAPDVFPSGDFLAQLDRKFIDTMAKQRKYTGGRLLDLLRALRNKKNHYEDMPDDVKVRVGPLPDGYLKYWTSRFPGLLMSLYNVVAECHLRDADRFRGYFEVQ